MPDPNRPFDVAAPQAPGDAAPGSDTEQSPSQADTSSAQVVPVKDDQDSPWKDALELFFRQAIELLAPTLHAEIDWSVAPDFLDKELQAIAIPGKQGRRFVDKLVRVRLLAGTDAWLLIHVEVERRLRGRQALRLFSWRMYEYRHRIQVRIMRQRQLDLPPTVYAVDKAPHSKLFELVHAVVHHGGAGTTHTGLYAGKPTFIVPQMFDQPYWGRRVYELGCGPAPVRLRKLTPSILATALEELSSDESFRAAAMDVRERLMHEDGTGLACDVIEETIASYPGYAHADAAMIGEAS